MEWLTQNWVWILLFVGFIFMMRRGGMGCGMGGGSHHHGGHHDTYDDSGRRPESAGMQTTVDPVSGQSVDPASAVTTVYRGRTYFFATSENRESFLAAPERYMGGHEEHEHRHRRHGC